MVVGLGIGELVAQVTRRLAVNPDLQRVVQGPSSPAAVWNRAIFFGLVAVRCVCRAAAEGWRRVVLMDSTGRYSPVRTRGLASFVVVALATLGLVASAAAARAVPSSSAVSSGRDLAALAQLHRAHVHLFARAHPARLAGKGAGQPTAGPARPAAPVGSQTLSSPVTGPALVFTDWNGGQVYGKNLATGAGLQVVSSMPGGCNSEPRLNPAGTYIVVVSDPSATCSKPPTQLWTMGSPSGGPTLLYSAPAHAWVDLPNWSADGSTILFTLEQDDSAGNFVSSQLYTVPAAGGSPTAIAGGGVMAFDGVYSPDGTKIVYAANVDTAANYLAVMNADGSGVVNLTSTGTVTPTNSSPGYPAWSPDGSRITFQYDKGTGTYHNWGIAVVNADGSGVHTLPVTTGSSTFAFMSSWSADSAEIFYDAIARSTTTGAVTASDSIFATDLSGQYRTTVAAATATDPYGDPFFVGPGPSIGAVSTFTPVTPTRVQPLVSLAQGGFVDVQVAGGASPVPAGATAVTLNLTGVHPTKATYLQVYPTPVSGSAMPTVSNLNLLAGQTSAVAAQVTVPASGYIRVRNSSGTTGMIVDVTGYFSAGSGAAGFTSLPAPVRVFDASIGQIGHADITVTGLAGAPANPVAVVLNMTADKPTIATWESVVPTPLSGVPGVSNLNLAAHSTRANMVTVQVGAGGKVTVYNSSGTVRTIVDVIGYYAAGAGGLGYYPLNPTRTLDTRNGTNTPLGSTAPIGQAQTFAMLARGTTTTSSATISVPTGARAVVFNLTAVQPTATCYLTVFSPSGSRPLASNLNAAAGSIVPNLVVSAVDAATGKVSIYNNAGKTPVIADIAGYYA